MDNKSSEVSGPLHEPVLVEEVLSYLDPRPGKVIVDATVGTGGHAAKILELLGDSGLLIGLDRDAQQLGVAGKVLSEAGGRFELLHTSFTRIPEVLAEMDIDGVDGVIFDLGASSWQLDHAERGFSFAKEGPLDMRMDSSQPTTAAQLVADLSETELGRILGEFGEERHWRRIARAIVRERSREPITSTTRLADVVRRAAGGPRRRIHPATRVFQALRIAVNNELAELERAVRDVPRVLARQGTAVFISFHSLEDRIVKHGFSAATRAGELTVLTKKPVTPTREEARSNRRSRSAKLRAAKRAA